MSNGNAALSVEDVTKSFGGLVAVSHVSLQVKEGMIVGLIGANGAGKTTLFNIISGKLKPEEGRIVFYGRDTARYTVNKICKLGIGRTFQIVQPFGDLTVLENTTVGALVRTRDVEKAKRNAYKVLELLEFADKAHVLGAELGLQYMKRMEIARALATEPKLLLLDEVMAGLNPAATEAMVEIIRKINKAGVTVLIIEHIMKAIMALSEKIYVMNQGNIIAEGLPDEVANDPEVIRSYLGERKNA